MRILCPNRCFLRLCSNFSIIKSIFKQLWRSWQWAILTRIFLWTDLPYPHGKACRHDNGVRSPNEVSSKPEWYHCGCQADRSQVRVVKGWCGTDERGCRVGGWVNSSSNQQRECVELWCHSRFNHIKGTWERCLRFTGSPIEMSKWVAFTPSLFLWNCHFLFSYFLQSYQGHIGPDSCLRLTVQCVLWSFPRFFQTWFVLIPCAPLYSFCLCSCHLGDFGLAGSRSPRAHLPASPVWEGRWVCTIAPVHAAATGAKLPWWWHQVPPCIPHCSWNAGRCVLLPHLLPLLPGNFCTGSVAVKSQAHPFSSQLGRQMEPQGVFVAAVWAIWKWLKAHYWRWFEGPCMTSWHEASWRHNVGAQRKPGPQHVTYAPEHNN